MFYFRLLGYVYGIRYWIEKKKEKSSLVGRTVYSERSPSLGSSSAQLSYPDHPLPPPCTHARTSPSRSQKKKKKTLNQLIPQQPTGRSRGGLFIAGQARLSI